MALLQAARAVGDLDAGGGKDRLGIAGAKRGQRHDLRGDGPGQLAEAEEVVDALPGTQVVGSEQRVGIVVDRAAELANAGAGERQARGDLVPSKASQQRRARLERREHVE